ncbi:MAG TPA: PAS domain-containing protein, partial [Phycisphaerales bacterium]|nr:PAS domain-containing protein [Phycisphaerales bacterium]
MLPPLPPQHRQARKTRFDLTAVLIRRRKAAVALLLALSIGVAALALISFMRLMPVRGDAAHSVEALERVRVLENALTRAYEAAINRDRTPREAQALWSDVARYAKPVSEIEPDDDEEARAIKGFNDDATEALKSIAEGVSFLERSDPLLAASARQNARIGIDRMRDAARSVGDTAARQLDHQMGAARLWLAICIGLVFLTGLMMAVTVLTWVYANHADRARARRLNPGVPAGEAYAEAALRLSLMIDRGPLAVVEWNSDYTCTRWSGRAEEMFGRPAADVVGKR